MHWFLWFTHQEYELEKSAHCYGVYIYDWGQTNNWDEVESVKHDILRRYCAWLCNEQAGSVGMRRLCIWLYSEQPGSVGMKKSSVNSRGSE